MKKIFYYSENTSAAGLLLLRLGIGIMFMIHGFPKISGGPEMWVKIGAVMSVIGINFGFTYWGFMAASAEFIGGLFLIFGLFTRPVSFLMMFTMIMATVMHYSSGDSFGTMSHAIEAGIVFLALMITGPGKLSLDYMFFKKKR